MKDLLSEKAVAIVALVCATFLAWKGVIDPATAKGILWGAAMVSTGTGLQALLARLAGNRTTAAIIDAAKLEPPELGDPFPPAEPPTKP